MKSKKKKKPRVKAIEHRVNTIDIEFTQRGGKRRLLRVQRYRKPVKIKDINYSRNPDKISFGVIIGKYNNRIEMFTYKNKPEIAFISLNGEVFRLDKFKWRHLMSLIFKTGKYLGLLK